MVLISRSPSSAWAPARSPATARPGQVFTFYEIDPLVERIARNANLFTYLKDCPPQTSVIIGDARVTLARAPNGSHGVLLDAFSGDSIPIHLLTLEAIELYLAKLVPDGVLLFHISNRYMDLTRVLERIATKLKLTALVQQDVKLSEPSWSRASSHRAG